MFIFKVCDIHRLIKLLGQYRITMVLILVCGTSFHTYSARTYVRHSSSTYIAYLSVLLMPIIIWLFVQGSIERNAFIVHEECKAQQSHRGMCHIFA